MSSIIVSLVLGALASAPVLAQSKVAFVDSEHIYSRYPEFATVQQQLDRQAEEWTVDLEDLQSEIKRRFQEYQARELLYTNDERQRMQEEIMQAEEELESRRMQYFGPEGELYRLQDQLLRPIQEKVLEAVEIIAQSEGYDFVFDRSGDYVFLFSNEQHNISDAVLQELGIDVQQTTTPGEMPPGERPPGERPAMPPTLGDPPSRQVDRSGEGP